MWKILLILTMLLGLCIAAQPRVILLANSIDYELSPEFREFLGDSGLEVVHPLAGDFAAYEDEGFVVILGGPDAPEGIGEIVGTILDEGERGYLRLAKGNRGLYVKTNVWSDGQVVMVLAGNDRGDTERAARENEEWVGSYGIGDVGWKSPCVWARDVDELLPEAINDGYVSDEMRTQYQDRRVTYHLPSGEDISMGIARQTRRFYDSDGKRLEMVYVELSSDEDYLVYERYIDESRIAIRLDEWTIVDEKDVRRAVRDWSGAGSPPGEPDYFASMRYWFMPKAKTVVIMSFSANVPVDWERMVNSYFDLICSR